MPEPTKRISGKKRVMNVRETSAPDQMEHGELREVTRWVPIPMQNLLWGIAAGRCEFEGCNEPLWKNGLTQEVRVLGQKAHIRAFSAHGPRGTAVVKTEDVNKIDNLMLLCPICHLTIDKGDGPSRYTVERLRAMKVAHEARISAASSISDKRRSHVLTYATHVGAHHALPTLQDANAALLAQRRYPASTAIDLSTRDGADPAVERDFWQQEANRLTRQFDRQVRQPLECGEITHISCFALAPQPLLIKIGTLLGDIVPIDTYQRHREPPTWEWPADCPALAFEVSEPPATGGAPALVLSISATITPDRIERVLGTDASVWSVAVPAPHNDIVKSPATLAGFRATLRPVLDRIKAAHGHRSTLHVFPATPVSLAVEFGRIRMPKADMPWLLYDEQSSLGGFIPALTIAFGA
jgi:hypothetical protein